MSDDAVWVAAYAACLSGMLAGPQGTHFGSPHSRPSMDGAPYIDSVSQACRRYADRAVEDFKKRAAG